MTYIELSRHLKTAEAMEQFNKLYRLHESGYAYQMTRYGKLLRLHEDVFANDDGLCVVSSPGRCEMIGNHTDHNGGIVLTAAINLDTLACVARRRDMTVQLHSEGYQPVTLDLNDLKPQEKEIGTTAAIIRGVASRMHELGYQIGGFDANVTSNVLSGSGLSSSAAFEVLICAVLDHLYNGFIISATERAQIAQYTENHFFGKPCGLMDQLACSAGDLNAIDFKSESPVITPVHYSFYEKGYAIAVVNTGGSHNDLTESYASIPKEMKAVANLLEESMLRNVRREQFMQQLPFIREKAGDRAALRALHFFSENDRVLDAASALQNDDIEAFLSLVQSSGISSWTLLQNVVTTSSDYQPLAIALAVANMLLEGRGASRVHGGGFAGTTLHFVPVDMMNDFSTEMDRLFGENACRLIDVRPDGATVVFA